MSSRSAHVRMYVTPAVTRIQGPSVTSDGLLVLDATWPEERLAVLDAATRKALWSVTALPFEPRFCGLACDAN